MTETPNLKEFGTIQYGDIVFKTTKRYVRPFGPHNKIVESNNRKAADSEWTECERLADAEAE